MKSKIFVFSLFFLLSVVGQAFAQSRAIFNNRGKNDTIPIAVTIYNGEYMPWVSVNPIPIREVRTFSSSADKNAYLRLRRNVLKVLPYAKMAREKYQKLQRDLALTSDKEKQKILVKTCEKDIKEMFYREVKQLSINQGKILIKLIDRETGQTSYELVKELKGTLSAFFLQSMARMFGHDLKSEYDPRQERDIEAILVSVGYNHPN